MHRVLGSLTLMLLLVGCTAPVPSPPAAPSTTTAEVTSAPDIAKATSTLTAEELKAQAEGPCIEFGQAYSEWRATYLRSRKDLGERTDEDDRRLTEAAGRLAPQVEDEVLHRALDFLSTTNRGSVNSAGSRVVGACEELGYDVSPTTPPDVLAAEEEERRSAARMAPHPNAPTRAPSSPSPGTAPQSQQRQALDMMWQEMSPSYRLATCDLYRESPAALIDAFMSEAAGLMDEQTVRDFYRTKCS